MYDKKRSFDESNLLRCQCQQLANNYKYYVLKFGMSTTANYIDKYAFKVVLNKRDGDHISTVFSEKDDELMNQANLILFEL